jgi:hypothetical protein
VSADRLCGVCASPIHFTSSECDRADAWSNVNA